MNDVEWQLFLCFEINNWKLWLPIKKTGKKRSKETFQKILFVYALQFVYVNSELQEILIKI